MDPLSALISDIILVTGQNAQTFKDNLILLNFSLPQIILDIALVSIVFYFIISLIKGSRAVHIVFGLSILAFIYFLSKAMQLVALGWLLDRFMTMVLVAIPIIFQKELRTGLERLGQTKLFQMHKSHRIDLMISAIVESSKQMAEKNIGGLIVVQRKNPLKEYIENGIKLDAVISTELLLSIFKPKTPLHDGAVIIANEKIAAASCVLPHSTEAKLYGLGTRHKAAVGLSENSDAVIVVISEEKGIISFAFEGELDRNISPEKLQNLLHEKLNTSKK